MTNEAARFTLRLPAELKMKLEVMSEKMGISLNALVIYILGQYMEERT